MLIRNELLRKHDVLQAIDERVRQLHPQRRGWIAADPVNRTMTIVHVRPYLAVQGMPPTMRVETDELGSVADLASVVHASAYVVVFLRPSPSMVPEHAPYMQELQVREIPWIAVWKDRKVLCTADADGAVLRLRAQQRPEMTALELSGNGDATSNLSAQIPFRLRIHADNDKAFFSLAVRQPSGFFDDRSVYYSCATADGTAIATTAEVDVALRIDAPDALVLHADSRFQLKPAPVAPLASRGARPVVLHVIYDRTMLDVGAWQTALDQADGVSAVGETALGGTVLDTRGWNRSTRAALATALAKLSAAQSDVTIELWWFADIERGRIAGVPGIEIAAHPHGRVGECTPAQLLPVLSGASFHYAPGLDLFDAVDEALLDLSARVPTTDEARHVVIVVGDSPPPPEGPADVIWQRILVDEFTSNARTSPDFRIALVSLKAKRVPVGWLFLTPTDAPELPNTAGLAARFATMQSIRQRVREALNAIDGLTVVSCPSLGEMDARLAALFDRLRDRHAPSIARLSLQEAV